MFEEFRHWWPLCLATKAARLSRSELILAVRGLQTLLELLKELLLDYGSGRLRLSHAKVLGLLSFLVLDEG